MITFSIIIPVYNRPDELGEILHSLSIQSDMNFEVIIVEDGSTNTAKEISSAYKKKLDIKYFFKDNEGPAIARNFGVKKASGNYYIFFDSDCIIPPDWFKIVRKSLEEKYVDAFGGPDSAAPEFNSTQKAINYTMTSFITTGGTRGSKKHISRYYPRSFNMGISDKVFRQTGGFPVTRMHPGEDMIFSIEIVKNGFKTKLISEAFVYHKRRTNFQGFYKQVHGFGKTRFLISLLYPETFIIFYIIPALFLSGCLGLIICSLLIHYLFLSPIVLFIILIFTHSLIITKNFKVGLYSIIASFYQLFGYGAGFISALWKKGILNKDEYGLFKKVTSDQ